MTMVLLLLSLGCVAPRAPARGDADALVGGDHAAFSVPGWPDRDYLVHLPPGYTGADAIPLVLGLHGGGGKKEGFDARTCPDGDTDADTCLLAVADREGFAVVMPDGVSGGLFGKRSWNAGGGEDGWRCVGGEACATGSDDVAYVDDLLAEIDRAVLVDGDRVYATGLSNGAAMAYRLACERADVFAAIGPVAGADQAGAWPGCTPVAPVPLLHVHGTEDPCWGYDGTVTNTICDASGEGRYRPVEDTLAAWRAHNGCVGTAEEPVADAVADGTTTTRVSGTGCAADTVLLRVEGGGHTWPGGDPYLPERSIGRVALDFSANEELWAFFAAHPRAGG